MALNIAREIAVLKSMTVGQLREKYHAVFGEPTEAGNKDFLFKRIVWRIQSQAEGDLSERARKRAAEIARDADIRMTIPRPPKLSAGAELRTVAAPAALGDNRLPILGTPDHLPETPLDCWAVRYAAATAAAIAIAAVSTRRIVSPRLMQVPWARCSSSSSVGDRPPSGPMMTARARGDCTAICESGALGGVA